MKRKFKAFTGRVIAGVVAGYFALSPLPVFAKEDVVTISFAGDCTLGSYKGSSNSFSTYWDPQNPGYFMQNVKDIFASDDLTFVNLEGPLTANEQEAVKTYSMKGEPEYINILTSGSVEVVNLANNHTYDCGQNGFEDTASICQSHDIDVAGSGYIAGKVVNNLTVYFLGYTAWEDNKELRSIIAEDIQVCKEIYGGDLVCVQLHWGTEREYYPSKSQQDLAHFIIDSGADVLVGSHPHVTQGIEKYNGHVIAYSLGNFCFGGNSNPSDKDSMILQVSLNKNGDLVKCDVIPCSISSVATVNDFCPTPQTGKEGDRILEKIRSCSEIFETSVF